jgi:AmmeMemoRadiSam system protein A
MNIYTDLVKNTLEEYLVNNKLPEVAKLPKELLNKHAGCFVSIHKKPDNALRGCVGTIVPRYKNLGGEIIANTVSAAFHDNRFEPVTQDELPDLIFSVDVLEEPEIIKDEKDLDIEKYGLIVKSNDNREGLLLPNIEGIETNDDQIKIAKEKAGIMPDEDVLMYRFKTTRYE